MWNILIAAIVAVGVAIPTWTRAAVDATQQQAEPDAPDDPDSPFTRDGHCKPGRVSCFELAPDETEPPPDATALRIMRAIRSSVEKLESATPHNRGTK